MTGKAYIEVQVHQSNKLYPVKSEEMTVVIIDTDMNSIQPKMNCIHKDRDK